MTILKLDSRSLFGSDGSGNQKKIWIDNKLIKLNSKFREASKEVSACVLAKAFGLDAVEYIKSEYMYDNRKCVGCECKSYLNEGDVAITLVEIINFYDVDIPQNMSAVDYFDTTVKCVNEYTGLSIEMIREYLMKMLVFDFLICNNDRHLTNIEFIFNEDTGVWRCAPLYDHGQSFLCRDGGLTNKEIDLELHKLKMKPFSTNAYKNLINLECAKEIVKQFEKKAKDEYGSINNIPINEFHKKIVRVQLERLLKKK